jgi:hypothetical protein
MSRGKLFVETSVACKVGTRALQDTDWRALVQDLRRDFDFVVSPLSFVEVLNSLARGSEQSILPNRRRLEALSPVDPLNPTFLEMPGQFLLREVLGCPAVLVDTYQPQQMAEAMVAVLMHNSVTPELRAWLAEIKSNHHSGTSDHVAKHDLMRTVGQTMPDRELWLRAILTHLGILLPSEDELRKLGEALDAAYQYSARLRRQLENPSYTPSSERSAWVDNQQLFYLCDPTVHILYLDGDFTQRTSGSNQQSRLLRLSDVIAQAGAKSLTSA